MQRISVFMALILVLVAATYVCGAGSETKQMNKATSTATKTAKGPGILLIKTDAQNPFKVQITDKSLWTNVEVKESEEVLELIVLFVLVP